MIEDLAIGVTVVGVIWWFASLRQATRPRRVDPAGEPELSRDQMNIDAALATIAGIDGAGLDLGERPPVWPDFPIGGVPPRYARLAALMDSQGFDALVLTQEEPVRYLSGYNSVIWAVGRWLPTVLVATRDPRQAALIASSFDAGCAAGTSWVGTVDTYRGAEEIPGKVRAHLAGSRRRARTGRLRVRAGQLHGPAAASDQRRSSAAAGPPPGTRAG